MKSAKANGQLFKTILKNINLDGSLISSHRCTAVSQSITAVTINRMQGSAQ